MRLAIILLALGLAPGAALAQDPVGDPAAGRDFARDICADCHDVEAEPATVSLNGPRSFAEVARDPKMTETALRVFLQTPHEQMPDFVLSAEQTDNVIAYIQSLSE